MDEQVLIKGEIDKKLKSFLQKAPIILIGVAIICGIFLSLKFEYPRGKTTDFCIGWAYAFWFDSFASYVCLII